MHNIYIYISYKRTYHILKDADSSCEIHTTYIHQYTKAYAEEHHYTRQACTHENMDVRIGLYMCMSMYVRVCMAKKENKPSREEASEFHEIYHVIAIHVSDINQPGFCVYDCLFVLV